ncbi:protein of unknown function (plasmid) [Cupriavidus neocaledonicus]|uniref:Uncharacterized protein n=1 Tax=Cupriavidus neocaledonicus TaxID=1040979 RepID=A0A375HNU0_9BURK|nr:protein of unknown function [Cupriavidus neocaledonicus]
MQMVASDAAETMQMSAIALQRNLTKRDSDGTARAASSCRGGARQQGGFLRRWHCSCVSRCGKLIASGFGVRGPMTTVKQRMRSYKFSQASAGREPREIP